MQADLLDAVSARLGLRSEPKMAMSGRTPKYLPLPQPTSASTAAGGKLSRNSLTCSSQDFISTEMPLTFSLKPCHLRYYCTTAVKCVVCMPHLVP